MEDEMLTNDEINNLLGISENYKAPNRVRDIIKDKEAREQVFKAFLANGAELDRDEFLVYVQEQADRNKKKQVLTPYSIGRLIAKLLDKQDSIADIASGTGSLLISQWATNRNAFVYAEEVSDQLFPFLLFNATMRNMTGIIAHMDSLTREVKEVYRLNKTEHFSNIAQISGLPERSFSSVIENPPYSLSYTSMKMPDGLKEYPLPPKSKADLGFVLQGLSKLSDKSTLVSILPDGVLFRGSREQTIRKNLIKHNLLDAVIQLPDKMFIGTDIPTVLFILKTNRTNKDILFLDVSKSCNRENKRNILTEANIYKIVKTYQSRKEIDRFCHIASIEQIEENGYNLNMPRYVDTFEAEPEVDLDAVLSDLIKDDEEIKETSLSLANLFDELTSKNRSGAKQAQDTAEWLRRSVGNL